MKLLQSVQMGELSDDEMNPFYFPEPVAPLVSLKKRQKNLVSRKWLGQSGRLKRNATSS